MTNASGSEWEGRYEQHRFDDEAHEEKEHEPVVHARADIDAHMFPCGVDARANVNVGPDADVTCDGCNAELQRRENLKKTVLRAAASLVFALGHAGRAHHIVTVALREAVNAKDFAGIGAVATDVYSFARDITWAPRQYETIERFIAAVDAAGLRRSRGSLADALAAIPTGDGEAAPF
jgi:hypothetical protein